MNFPNLRSYLEVLHKQNEIQEISTEVDPNLELAEIHRRVIEQGGPALLFRNVRGSNFPVVTNLFGTRERVELAFGDEGPKLIKRIAKLPLELFNPEGGGLFKQFDLLPMALRVGTKITGFSKSSLKKEQTPDLEALPLITSWHMDGGPFITLPLVYTEHPELGSHNLGMYRMQRYSSKMLGLHMQIGKGGGFHLSAAKELGRNLDVNVFVGGPPVTMLAAISPLPENVPELMLASLLLGKKIEMAENPDGPLPLLNNAEFVLVGTSDPDETQPEGPFGDHYGYYSLTHDFPVFRCNAIYRRDEAVYPATVVGKPRQEDYYIGNYLQELLSPIFPLVMPSVIDLWSYGETGYHSLAAAVVRERYKREAMVSAFRILGEGQLSLTKFLILLDRPQNLQNFREVLTYVLERCDFRTDLYIFSNLSMDTLDYTGPTLNEGSKGVLLGMGEPIRELPREFQGELPADFSSATVFSPGCLVVRGPEFRKETKAAERLTQCEALQSWPLVIISDDPGKATRSEADFLWNVFTRFEPAADVYGRQTELHRFHPMLESPVVIDTRMKPNYPDELECDEETAKLVDRRWGEYGLG